MMRYQHNRGECPPFLSALHITSYHCYCCHCNYFDVQLFIITALYNYHLFCNQFILVLLTSILFLLAPTLLSDLLQFYVLSGFTYLMIYSL